MVKALIYGKCADSSSSTAFTTFKNTWDTISDKIQKATVYGSLGESSALGWGLQDIGRVEIELTDVTATEKAYFITGTSSSSELHCFASFDDTTYPVGKFYINKVESKPRNDGNYDLTITAYDSLVLADAVTYVPSSTITFPTTPRIVMADVLSQCGLTSYSTSKLSTSTIITQLFSGLSCRQMINYIALINAGYTNYGSVVNWINSKSSNGINVSSYLNYTYYGYTTRSITWDTQYQGENKETADDNIVYGGIITGSDDGIITYPSTFTGQAANFENPFMTSTIAQNFYTRVINNGNPLINYIPVEIKYRPSSLTSFGNLIGNKLLVYKKDGTYNTSYLSDFSIVFGGGFYINIKGFGASDSEKEFVISPTQAQIKREASRLETALSEATSQINGVNGGYVKILDLDGDGNPDNIFITDAEITESDIIKSGEEYVLKTETGVTNVIRINYNGLGISTGINAGTSVNGYKTAITGSSVNASAITTGTMSADRISTGSITGTSSSWNLDTGNFTNSSSSTGAKTLIQNGNIAQYSSSGNLLGIQAPMSSGNLYYGMYYNKDVADGISFGYTDSNAQNFDRTVQINADSLNVDGKVVVECGSAFSGLISRNSSDFEAKVGTGTLTDVDGNSARGVSIVVEKKDGVSTGTNQTYARLDVAGGTTKGSGSIRCWYEDSTGSKSYSKWLSLSSSNLYWGNNQVTTGSSEAYKKDISVADFNALPLVNKSIIYNYHYNEDQEDYPIKYGLIIERECPKEVVDNSGDAINLYSMVSIGWKAIQELSDKVKKLEKRIEELEKAGDTNDD